MGFRTEATQNQYDEIRKRGHLEQGCPLCEAVSLKEFEYWRVVDNRYPYDKISQIHHMVIPKRHVIENVLTNAEKDELIIIKDTYLGQHYAYMLEALTGQKSIPEHFHLHVLVPKEF